MKKRVLLAEQHLRRGVDANAVTASYLESAGITSRLCLTGAQLCSHLLRFQPHVVYYPWIAPYAYRFLSTRETSVPIVNAFQEQNVVLHRPNCTAAQRAGKADYIFAWGPAQKKKMEKLFVQPTVYLTGNPRFDPYFDSRLAETLYASRKEMAAQYNLSSEKDWVLLALDFSLVFESENRVRQLIDQGDLPRKAAEVARRTYQTLQEWMRKLAADDLGSTLLIVRPHPGSDLKQIKRNFGGESRYVRFIKGGSIPPWIIAANRYITRASTSIVEAWISDVPTALIGRDEQIEVLGARPHLREAETSLDSYAEFRDFVISGPIGGSRHSHHNFLASHYRLDGQSARRTASKLRSIAADQNREPQYEGGVFENAIEHAKFAAKKFLNESGLNRWNPLDRPNDEFLSQDRARKMVDSITAELNLNGKDEAVQ